MHRAGRWHRSLLLLVSIATCATRAVAVGAPQGDLGSRPAGQTPSSREPTQFHVVMHQGPCFGTCPSYRVDLRWTEGLEGRVVFEGKSHVRAWGQRSRVLEASEVSALAGMLTSAEFWALRDRYEDRQITCLSSTSLTVDVGSRRKVIEHYHGDPSGPPFLSVVENAISARIDRVRWLGEGGARDGWLARHQELDGSWNPETLSRLCDERPGYGCALVGKAEDTIGMTGLATIAVMLGPGFRTNKRTREDALRFLPPALSARAAPGAPALDPLSHAIATAALWLGSRSGTDETVRSAAESALTRLLALQAKDGCWPAKAGRDHSEPTAWALLAMKAAMNRTRAPIPRLATTNALAFIAANEQRSPDLANAFAVLGPRWFGSDGGIARNELSVCDAVSRRLESSIGSDTSIVFTALAARELGLPIRDRRRGNAAGSGLRRTDFYSCGAGSVDPPDGATDAGLRIRATALADILDSVDSFRVD
jgi:hypothetical protein